ncbi:MAG: hypothetical protein GC160_29290 [Acidobacteria bacterium]|nr:hypothetical protein [Acidobacteriota bacterium]
MRPLALLALCASTVAAAEPPSFTKDVAPILFENCMSCHREGEAAPFPLTSYSEAKKRGALISAVTEARYMPPWHAAPADVRYRDERRLSEEQIGTLKAWVEAGMPEGDPGRLPAPPEFAEGWQLGEPDLVVRMPEAFEVPAEGPDLYRSFAIPLPAGGDRWVRAIEFRPSARGASHHALFFADPSGEALEADSADGGPGFAGMRELRRSERGGGLGGWAVGGAPQMLPDGLARPLPAGSALVVQMHFHPSGKIEREQASLGLYFAPEAPQRTLTGVQTPPLFGRLAGIDIPAGESRYVVKDSFELPIAVDAYGVGGHAHYLCSEMKMTATLPGGEVKTLLWIDRWDFAWQERYYFREPLRLPAGTVLETELIYDNSAANPANPHRPPRHVAWGRGSEDEMGSVSLEVLAAKESELAELRAAQRRQIRQAIANRFLSAISGGSR